jgi:hypothetical protein
MAFPGIATVGPHVGYERSRSSDVRTEQADKYQRVVNEAQIARLNEMIKVLDEDILESDQHFTYVIIDDLDRDWVDSRIANDLLRCLFRAVWDFQQMKHLKIIVALRTNIFEHLNFGSSMGGQEEKFRANTHYMRWTAMELEALASDRAIAAGEYWKIAGGLASIRSILPRTGKRRGDPFGFILDRTLMRPRDVISFINECLVITEGRTISWEDIWKAWPIYSKNRLSALRDEWKPTFPGIEEVLEVFRGCAFQFDLDSMEEKLLEVGMLLQKPSFPGVVWLTRLTEGMWSGGEASWAEQYQPLLRMLFEIGFIGCVSPHRAGALFAYNIPDYAVSPENLQKSQGFLIHPAFRPALEIVEESRVDAEVEVESDAS